MPSDNEPPVAARLAAIVAAPAVGAGPKNVTFKCDWSEDKRPRNVVSPVVEYESSSSNDRVVLEMRTINDF